MVVCRDCLWMFVDTFGNKVCRNGQSPRCSDILDWEDTCSEAEPSPGALARWMDHAVWRRQDGKRNDGKEKIRP